MKNIAVIFGGKSVEHDVSVITGVMTANTLDKSKYNVIPVLVTQSGEWVSDQKLLDIDGYKKLDLSKMNKVTLTSGKNVLYQIKGKKLKEIAPIYAVINCMHGGLGEDGSFSGIFSACGIALVGSGVLSSAVSINKRFTKTVLKGLGVSTLPCIAVSSAVQAMEKAQELTYPVIVKPNLLGSSIGVEKVKDQNQLCWAVNSALRFGDLAVIEPCLENFTEINCAAYSLGEDVIVSECEQPKGKQEVLSFSDKYEGGERVFPADINKRLSDKIKNITKKVYTECEFSGVVRIDYFISDGKVYLNEINSVPGSLAYYLFCDRLKDFSVMLDKLITSAVAEQAKKSTYSTQYHSGILTKSGTKGAKKRLQEKR